MIDVQETQHISSGDRQKSVKSPSTFAVQFRSTLSAQKHLTVDAVLCHLQNCTSVTQWLCNHWNLTIKSRRIKRCLGGNVSFLDLCSLQFLCLLDISTFVLNNETANCTSQE